MKTPGSAQHDKEKKAVNDDTISIIKLRGSRDASHNQSLLSQASSFRATFVPPKIDNIQRQTFEYKQPAILQSTELEIKDLEIKSQSKS